MSRRETFATLENDSEQGEVLSSRQEGSTPTGKNGAIGFAFKDNAGNLVLPQLNPEGALTVTFDAGTTLRANALWAEGSQTKNQFDDALILPLTAEKTYTSLSVSGSGTRTGIFEVYRRDDAGQPGETDTLLGGFLVGAGNYNGKLELKQDIFNTIGGTGTQQLVIKFNPIDKESDVYIQASVNEVS